MNRSLKFLSSDGRIPFIAPEYRLQFFGVLAAASPAAIERTKLLYLGAAFAFTWIAIAAYLFSIFRRQRRLENSIENIRAQANRE